MSGRRKDGANGTKCRRCPHHMSGTPRGAGDWMTAGMLAQLLTRKDEIGIGSLLASVKYGQRLSTISIAFDGPAGRLDDTGRVQRSQDCEWSRSDPNPVRPQGVHFDEDELQANASQLVPAVSQRNRLALTLGDNSTAPAVRAGTGLGELWENDGSFNPNAACWIITWLSIAILGSGAPQQPFHHGTWT